MKSFVWFRRLATASLIVPFLLTAAPAADGHGFGGGGGSHGGGGFAHGGGGFSHGGFSRPGFSRGGFSRSFAREQAFNHAFEHDRRFDHDRDFDHRFGDHDRFRHDRFFFGFDFAAFGYPWWYPDYYYWYPSDYPDSYYTYYGPSYDPQYWTNLAFSVQTTLTQLGYYHGTIDGTIGADSREAIRAFQAKQKLPVTGTIDPTLLNALGIRYRTA
ncbi:MAG: peptidoglycan-binding protein [Verrucomicrobia bacterium]|nr:peptidoglycan-binding protein [Verrucomicrobiota bacterium]